VLLLLVAISHTAVKMMQARTLVDKRVGYLACSLVLHSEHPFVLLIIGSIQRDLKSEIYLEVTHPSHSCL
jgi:AP-4 complex subunit epsilon-1